MSRITTTIHDRQLNDLIPYANNPKIHPPEQIDQIANSINEWGFTIPLLIDGQNNVLAGHGRLLAAKSIGMDKVPCIIAEGWSEDQKKAYIIADNKLAENSEWDNSTLYQELKKISESNFDLSLMDMAKEFENMEFSPTLEPFTISKEITNADIETAQKNIEKQIEGATGQKDEQGIQVICPYCSEEFTVSGY